MENCPKFPNKAESTVLGTYDALFCYGLSTLRKRLVLSKCKANTLTSLERFLITSLNAI